MSEISVGTSSEGTAERVLLRVNPAMFRAAPGRFLLCLLLVPVVVGIVILVIWWLQTRRTTLTLTGRRTTLRRGLVSVAITEVWHEHVRNVQIRQGVMQRLMGVGSIAIASAGKGTFEIELDGIPRVYEIKGIIDRNRQPAGA